MKYSFLTFLYLSFFAGVHAQTAQQVFDNWMNDGNLSNAQVACTFYDIDQKKDVFSMNASAWMTPASTLKMLTTSTALGVLGDDFVYETNVFLSGNQQENVLQGDLHIVGSGDPTFGSNEVTEGNDTLVFQQITQALQARNITRIVGHLRVHVGMFGTDALGPQWPWEDIGNYYGGGAWALNYRDNEYDIFFRQNNTPGNLVALEEVRPYFPGLQLINEVVSGEQGSRDNAFIFGAPYTYYKHIRGSIPPGNGLFDIQGAMPEPPYQFGWLLKAWLQKRGIEVLGQVLVDREEVQEATSLLVFKSKPLSWISSRTNEKSVNLYAEALLRTIGLKTYGKGTIDNGIKAIIDFWKKRDIDLDTWKIVDGSGLSPNNLVRATEFAQLLVYWQQDKDYENFIKTLPRAGVNGTMKYFLRNSNLQNNLSGKSGSISNCRNYVGYFNTMSGRTIAFTVFLNKYPEKDARLQIERLLKNMWPVMR